MQQRAFSQAGSSYRITSYSRCHHSCTGGATHIRRNISVASVSYEQSVPPPPPPPPPPTPPPMQQDFSRRGALAYAGAAIGFVMTGASAGWVLASNRAGDNSGNYSGAEQLEIVSLREEAGFRRDFDGSLWLQEPSGTWHEAKLDAKMPGTVLLRNDENSIVSYITYSIQQIDLTDDNVVTSVFGDRNWPALIQPLQVRNENDEVTVLILGRVDFQNLVSMME